MRFCDAVQSCSTWVRQHTYTVHSLIFFGNIPDFWVPTCSTWVRPLSLIFFGNIPTPYINVTRPMSGPPPSVFLRPKHSPPLMGCTPPLPPLLPCLLGTALGLDLSRGDAPAYHTSMGTRPPFPQSYDAQVSTKFPTRPPCHPWPGPPTTPADKAAAPPGRVLSERPTHLPW